MCAVREWSIDFVEQSHINNARNWMAAVCHEIKETVSLKRCKCGESVKSNGIDGQLPPALNVQKTTSGRHHLAGLALSRVEVKASEPSEIAAMEKCERKRKNIQHPQKPEKKT